MQDTGLAIRYLQRIKTVYGLSVAARMFFDSNVYSAEYLSHIVRAFRPAASSWARTILISSCSLSRSTMWEAPVSANWMLRRCFGKPLTTFSARIAGIDYTWGHASRRTRSRILTRLALRRLVRFSRCNQVAIQLSDCSRKVAQPIAGSNPVASIASPIRVRPPTDRARGLDSHPARAVVSWRNRCRAHIPCPPPITHPRS
jgi:hypothetical protein